jgi:hypothetical protein
VQSVPAAVLGKGRGATLFSGPEYVAPKTLLTTVVGSKEHTSAGIGAALANGAAHKNRKPLPTVHQARFSLFMEDSFHPLRRILAGPLSVCQSFRTDETLSNNMRTQSETCRLQAAFRNGTLSEQKANHCK